MNKKLFWVMWWTMFVLGLAGMTSLAYVAVHFIQKMW